MRKELSKRFLNIGLRALSLGSKFILIFAIAKLFEPRDVGLFGLMLATVSFSVLLIGADYYTYAQREMLARKPDEWSFVIQHQIKAQLFLYCVLLPVQLLIFIFDLMEWQFALWFFALLVVEHIAQEINRLLVAMHNQLMASWVLFIRAGSWVVIVIPLMVLAPSYQSLHTIYTAWFIGSLSAILWGGFVIKKAIPSWKSYKTDFVWLKRGLKVGGIFLVATLCFRGLLTFDRYAVESLGSIELLGVYVFYISIVMGSYAFLDPAVFSFLYPRMLQSYQAQKKGEYLKTFNELVISTVLISVLLAGVIWLCTPYIIDWLDKPLYAKYLDDLNILIAVGFVFAVGHIPHYALYSMKGDRWIVLAHVSALIVFFLSLILLNMDSGIGTVAVALMLAFIWMALTKSIGFIVTKQHSLLLKI